MASHVGPPAVRICPATTEASAAAAGSALALPMLLAETALLGLGFGLNLSVINHFAASLFPRREIAAVTVLNAVIGGAGCEVERVLTECGLKVSLVRLGLPDRFIDHGEQGQLLADLGLDKDGILRTVRERIRTQQSIEEQS